MKTFQQPLSPEEEKACLLACIEGDRDARLTLIERNLRLVAHVAKKYQNTGEDTDDLISIGTIGLIKAINTFDHSRGKRLATYAAKCIDNELLMYFRAKKKTSREVSLYEPIGIDKEGNEINLLDIMESDQPSAFDLLSQKQDVSKVLKLMETMLEPREYQVLLFRYGLCHQPELTQREIAARLGISRSYVSRIEKNALEKLRHGFLTP